MAQPCEQCGSLACEWEGPMQLGCTDCGWDLPERKDDTKAVESIAREIERSTLDDWVRIIERNRAEV